MHVPNHYFWYLFLKFQWCSLFLPDKPGSIMDNLIFHSSGGKSLIGSESGIVWKIRRVFCWAFLLGGFPLGFLQHRNQVSQILKKCIPCCFLVSQYSHKGLCKNPWDKQTNQPGLLSVGSSRSMYRVKRPKTRPGVDTIWTFEVHPRNLT